MTANLPASIHARLLQRAKAGGEDFNQVLGRYATERFLFRLWCFLYTLPRREKRQGNVSCIKRNAHRYRQWKVTVTRINSC